MPHVYECARCGGLMLNKGMTLHLSRIHGITDDVAGVVDDSLDIKIDHLDVPFGSAGLTYKLGSVVAKWMFEVGGDHSTKFIRGNIILYRLWVNERVRTVNNRPGVDVRAPTYLENYLKNEGKME